MNKTSVLVGALILSVSVWCFNGFGGPGELQQKLMARKAVVKVFAERSFTPPITLEGPTGVVYYVGCRSGGPQEMQQAVVRVQGTNAFNVELVPFQRTSPEASWTQSKKSDSPIVLALERGMKGQLAKELAAEEK